VRRPTLPVHKCGNFFAMPDLLLVRVAGWLWCKDSAGSGSRSFLVVHNNRFLQRLGETLDEMLEAGVPCSLNFVLCLG